MSKEHDKGCVGCQFASTLVPIEQSSCMMCTDHRFYTPYPPPPPSPDEDLFQEMLAKIQTMSREEAQKVMHRGRTHEELYEVALKDIEANPENYNDIFEGYKNDPAKALALVDWQKGYIKSLEMTVDALMGMLTKKNYFVIKENGEVVPLSNGCPVAGTHQKKVEKQLGTISINPCCRCGGKATVKELRHIECGHGDYMDYFWVECKKCGKRGADVGFYCGDKDEHIDRAIQCWNQLTDKEQD